jgi:hypothetical protein
MVSKTAISETWHVTGLELDEHVQVTVRRQELAQREAK